MRILIIEDQKTKIDAIEECILSNIDSEQCRIMVSENLSDARRQLISEPYDLIIFDVYLPATDDVCAETIDVSDEIISEFSKSKNYQTETIAITACEICDVENMNRFNETGVTVVHYSEEDGKWKNSLILKIKRIMDTVNYDFLIFCALAKERSAYSNTDAILGELKTLNGLNCQSVKIGSYNGLCITPARMGLVHMSISVAKGIEAFQPKIVAMSGICAGVEGEVNLLDLIIGDVCWEYQTGKYNGYEFKQEPYQAKINHQIRNELVQLTESEDVIIDIKKGLYDTELKDSTILLGPISSGSAVIASEEKMAEIGLQHRKMAGLEMEMYAMYETASQSLCDPLYFGAKAVVDLGDSSKGDTLHTTASTISARFVVQYLNDKLSRMS